MNILMLKSGGGLVPLSEEEAERVAQLKAGHVYDVKLVKKRNPEFHRRFFALLDVAYDAWVETATPPAFKGIPVLPNRERFRKDITILAGFYEPTFNVKGELRMEAKSISFSSMEQEEFEHLYSAVINVTLTRILTARGYTEQSLRAHVDRVLNFDR